MKLSIPLCPTCGKHAAGTVDIIPGIAVFTEPDGDGEVQYSGDTDIDWNGQEPRKGPNQLPLVTCGEHEWESEIIDD